MGSTSDLMDGLEIKIPFLHMLEYEAEEIAELLGRGVCSLKRFWRI